MAQRAGVRAELFLSAATWVTHGCSPSGVSQPQHRSPIVEVLELSKLLTPVLEPSGICCDWTGAAHAFLPHRALLQLLLLKPVQAQYILLNFNRNCQLFHSFFFCFVLQPSDRISENLIRKLNACNKMS